MTSRHPQLSPVDALAQLSFVVIGALERRAGERDLSLIQTRLLGVLRDRTPTMNELAALLQLDKSSVTGLVDRAERRGLVARQPSTTDRRSVTVTLSAKGRELVSTAANTFETDVVGLLAVLSDEDRATLVTLATHVVAGNAAAHGIDLTVRDQRRVATR